MTIRNLLLTAAAPAAILAFASPASAQLTTNVGTAVEAKSPANPVITDSVKTTVDQANDTATAVQPQANVGADTTVDADAGALAAATSADVTAGATVRDTDGGVVGKVESVNANGAVVATGKSRVQIPVTSFGKNNQGLVLAMTKAELDAAAAASSPS